MNGHIERRESKTKGIRYRALVFVDAAHGGPKWQTVGTFAREGQANAKLIKVLDAYLAGTYRKPSKITVEAMCEAWLTDHVAQLRPLSRQNYEGICRGFIIPEFGDELAESLTSADVAAWIARLLRDGRRDGRGGMAPKYVRQVRFVLRAAYAWSVKLGTLAVNPVDAAPGPSVPRRVSEPPDVARMQAAMAELADTRYHLPMVIAAATGMRRGEVLGLAWSHIDMAAGVVHVRRQLLDTAEGGTAFGALKTESARRDLHLPPFVLRALQAEKECQRSIAQASGRAITPDSLVCRNHDGGPIPPDKFSRGFTAILRYRGLPVFRFHDLRHALATEMLEGGERADVVARQLGHASVAVTLGVYAHLRPGETDKAAARYGQRFEPPEPQPNEVDSEPDEAVSAGTRTHSATRSAVVLDMDAARARKRPA